MGGARFDRVLLRRANLRRAFPPDFAARLTGTTVDAVTRRAKYLVLPLSSGEMLVMHLGMSGDLRVECPPGPGAPRPRAQGSEREAQLRGAPLPPPGTHDHVVFEMSSGCVVTFNDPRRFGMMDLLARDAPEAQETLAELGPEPLSPEFDAAALSRARALQNRPEGRVAGLTGGRGPRHIYAAEALHLAGLSPARRASTIATATGRLDRPPTGWSRPSGKCSPRRSRVSRRRRDRAARFRVYDREGEACPTRGCPGVIRRTVQGGRSTFFCRTCQR